MAGDWIKMRLDLQTHPKVVRILSATKSDKFRAIGGLHAVWSVFDTHSADGELSGYTPETLDHIIGWPGFANAMIGVGWLSFDGVETLSLPEFSEHNGKSGKRRAEDTKRKREERENTKNVAQNLGQSSDRNGTREEKRREDKEQAPAAPLPDWLPIDAWKAYLAMRKQIKKTLTVDGFPLAIKKLENLRSKGNDPRQVLEQSVLNSWQGLFEVKNGGDAGSAASVQKWD